MQSFIVARFNTHPEIPSFEFVSSMRLYELASGFLLSHVVYTVYIC